ncbi:hypothetical protein OA93_20790 [Flavobacterium sp. KMS]|uniref:hypothetical protein n=1 Tax=Flavobacterium sp. KMS TaxID=1566023 RepID=UPI00057EEBDF|nr:hypothetical protein [Flavobacterium sp. KMS]KIA93902.1 hypothetical protein OA93_20790 [Flavobacterium sp. KMS]KIC03733.1 hypothetical protein OA88_02110 [Flavobacterium sp. JRM]
MNKIVKFIFTASALLWLLITILTMMPIATLLLPTLLISKKHYTEWILFLFALICSLGVYPICFMYAVIKWNGFLSYLRKLSLSIDISGNMVAGALLNDNFIIASSTNKFGVVQETISDNLGENERDNTLSIFGKRFTNLLGVIDFNHAQKSIVED